MTDIDAKDTLEVLKECEIESQETVLSGMIKLQQCDNSRINRLIKHMNPYSIFNMVRYSDGGEGPGGDGFIKHFGKTFSAKWWYNYHIDRLRHQPNFFFLRSYNINLDPPYYYSHLIGEAHSDHYVESLKTKYNEYHKDMKNGKEMFPLIQSPESCAIFCALNMLKLYKDKSAEADVPMPVNTIIELFLGNQVNPEWIPDDFSIAVCGDRFTFATDVLSDRLRTTYSDIFANGEAHCLFIGMLLRKRFTKKKIELKSLNEINDDEFYEKVKWYRKEKEKNKRKRRLDPFWIPGDITSLPVGTIYDIDQKNFTHEKFKSFLMKLPWNIGCMLIQFKNKGTQKHWITLDKTHESKQIYVWDSSILKYPENNYVFDELSTMYGKWKPKVLMIVRIPDVPSSTTPVNRGITRLRHRA